MAGDHREFSSTVARWLEPHFSVWAMDRRGRGASGDGPRYALEREFEDVAAVIDVIGGPVDGVGYSFGATVALGALPLTTNVRRAVLMTPVRSPATTSRAGPTLSTPCSP